MLINLSKFSAKEVYKKKNNVILFLKKNNQVPNASKFVEPFSLVSFLTRGQGRCIVAFKFKIKL